MPDTGSAPDGTWAQVLIKLGEMAVDIGQVRTRLESWADIPERLRQVELTQERSQGSRDSLSRVLAIAGVILGLAAAAAAWAAVAHH